MVAVISVWFVVALGLVRVVPAHSWLIIFLRCCDGDGPLLSFCGVGVLGVFLLLGSRMYKSHGSSRVCVCTSGTMVSFHGFFLLSFTAGPLGPGRR